MHFHTILLFSSFFTGILCAPPSVEPGPNATNLNGSAIANAVAYRIPNTDPAIILSVESSRGSPRQISDVFVAMVEGLAAMAEHDPTEPFPDLVQSFKYQGMMLSIMATQRPTPNYRTIVAAVRGLAEYMSISQTFGKKNCRVLIGGEQVALVGLETSSSGGDLRSIGSALFEKTRLRKGNVAVSRT